MAFVVGKTGQCCPPCEAVETVQVPGPAGQPGTDGRDGAPGRDAFTYVTVGFEMPAQLANVTVSVQNTDWLVAGLPVFIETAGTFLVSLVVNQQSVTLTNLRNDTEGAYPDNADAGTPISAGVKMTATGFQGRPGGVEYSTAGDIELDSSNQPRIAITDSRGDLIVNQNQTTAPRNVRLARGTSDGQVLHTDSGATPGLAWRGIDLTGTQTVLAGALPVANGGTGGTTAQAARTALGAAAAGANADITSLSGLTTPLSVGQGGTGLTAFPAFRAHRNGSHMTGVPSNTYTKLDWTTLGFDLTNEFHLSPDNKFTVGTSGIYQLEVSLQINSLGAGQAVFALIYEDGSERARAMAVNFGSGARDIMVTCHAIRRLTAGSNVEAYIYYTDLSSTSKTIDGAATRTWFAGALICKA